MTTPTADEVRFARPAHFPSIELASARYCRRVFPRHFHDEYVIGAMTMGAERLAIRGSERVVRAGEMILIDPGEPHANRALDDHPFAYAVMYVAAPAMEALLAEAFHGAAAAPRFQDPRFAAPRRGARFIRLHRMMMAGGSRLEEESALLGFLGSLLFAGEEVDGGGGACDAAAACEPRSVRLAREYVDAHYREAVSLARLAEIAATSPFHLLRSFAARVGLPPAAYQTQLRLREARRRLRAGADIAETALALGFADQSHFTRQFQKYVGTSPGRYRAQ